MLNGQPPLYCQIVNFKNLKTVKRRTQTELFLIDLLNIQYKTISVMYIIYVINKFVLEVPA